MRSKKYTQINLGKKNCLLHLGPPLDRGPLPSILYLSLSAHDSLATDPFNQPALFLSSYPVRIFSLDLPGHDINLPPEKGLKIWCEEFKKNKNPISDFSFKIKKTIDYLIEKKLALPDKIALMGLSRGCFTALHAAALDPRIKTILGFAPLLNLSTCQEFEEIKDLPIIQSLNAQHLACHFINKIVRFYIGDKDQRVKTHHSQAFIEAIKKKSLKKAQAELIISPSIGYQGHGTSPQTFQDGCSWLINTLYLDTKY